MALCVLEKNKCLKIFLYFASQSNGIKMGSSSQMTATEQWIFLCAAHKTPKECPAIDYTRHTLDGAACLLNSNKYFPSRVSIKVKNIFITSSVLEQKMICF
jgi:hypothetical protein